MIQDRTAGLKRVRLIASIIGAVMFAFTGAEQFRTAGPEFVLPGVIVSALIGFGILFGIMTVVIHLIRMFRSGE